MDTQDGLQIGDERWQARAVQQCAGNDPMRASGEVSHDRNGRVGPQRCHECNRPLTADDVAHAREDGRPPMCAECSELRITEADLIP